MAKYSVIFQVFASMSVEVEADSEEQARELAVDDAFEPCLCHRCADVLQVDSVGDISDVEEIES